MSKTPEISDHKSTIVVSSLAGDADAVREKQVVAGEFLIPDQPPSHGNSRSSVATRGDVRRIVDLDDGGTIFLDVRKVLGVLFGYIYHISISWIRRAKEIPFAVMGNRSAKDNRGVGRSELTRKTFCPDACPVVCTWWLWQRCGVFHCSIEDSDACEPTTLLEGWRPKGVVRDTLSFLGCLKKKEEKRKR